LLNDKILPKLSQWNYTFPRRSLHCLRKCSSQIIGLESLNDSLVYWL
jgi:hypothetical protein